MIQNKFTLTILLVFMSLTFASGASAMDVRGLKGDSVKVEKLAEDRIKFSYCLKTHPNSCDPIGDEQGYTLTELRSVRSQLKHSGQLRMVAVVGGAVLAGAAIGAGTFAGAAYIGILSAAQGSASFGVGGLLALTGIGVAVGGAGGWKLSEIFAKPHNKFRQSKALSGSVINDEDVQVESLDTYVSDLKAALALIHR